MTLDGDKEDFIDCDDVQVQSSKVFISHFTPGLCSWGLAREAQFFFSIQNPQKCWQFFCPFWVPIHFFLPFFFMAIFVMLRVLFQCTEDVALFMFDF